MRAGNMLARALALLTIWACGAALAQQPVSPPARVSLTKASWSAEVTEPEKGVVFHGEFDPSQSAGAGGAMLYPAPNLVGFLAAVITHAVIVEGGKSAQREKAIAEADKVLEPLASVLAPLTGKVLTVLVGQRLGQTEVVAPDWQLDVAPVFVFSRDLRSLSVEAHLQARRAGTSDAAARSSIRVTLLPLAQPDPVAHWTQGQGQALRDQAAQLLAEAVRTGVREMSGEWDQVQAVSRTVRFPSGTAERIERVQVLEARCGQTVVRHLRGDLMVIPWQDPAQAAACVASPQAVSASAPG